MASIIPASLITAVLELCKASTFLHLQIVAPVNAASFLVRTEGRYFKGMLLLANVYAIMSEVDYLGSSGRVRYVHISQWHMV